MIADEASDKTSNTEVLSVCIRFVDETDSPKIREAFLEFVHLKRSTGRKIAEEILKVIEAAGLDKSMIRGQSYDGASCMSAQKEGVQAIIKEQVNDRALYTHCHSHILNLSICAACKESVISNFIGMINEAYLFFHLSPKRQTHFEKVLEIVEPDFKVKKLKGLCKTRWVERHECLESFCRMLRGFSMVLACWHEIIEPGTHLPDDTRSTWSWDAETKAKAQGLLSFFEKFSSSVLAIVLRNALNYVRPLASKLQKSDVDIYQAHQMISEVIRSLEDLQTNIGRYFSEWWKDILELSASDPSLPRIVARQTYRDNVPSSCNPHFCDCAQLSCPKSYYMRTVVLPFVNHLLSEMKTRFENRICVAMFQLIPEMLAQNDEIDVDSLRFWEMDLPSPHMLKVELQRWIRRWKDNIKLPSTLFETLQETDPDCFPNIHKLPVLGCTLPTTSAEAERSFSLFRHLKTHQRSTMSERRLSALSLMARHFGIDIDVKEVVKHFIQKHPRRLFQKSIVFD